MFQLDQGILARSTRFFAPSALLMAVLVTWPGLKGFAQESLNPAWSSNVVQPVPQQWETYPSSSEPFVTPTNDTIYDPYFAQSGNAWGNPGAAHVGPQYIGEEAPISILPYYSHLFYGGGSIKNQGDIAGMHTALDFKYDVFEFDFGYTNIDFKSGFRLQQYDTTAIYTSYWIPNIGIKGGVHAIGSNSQSTNGWIGILGFQYFETDRWDVGTDIFISRYDRFSTPVTALELNPKWGVYWHKDQDYTLRTEILNYAILYNKDIGLGQAPAFSCEGRISVDSGPWGYSFYGWGGRQSFAVRNGGFLVFNLNEERVAGYGGEARYSITKNSKLLFRMGNEHLRDSVNRTLTNQLVLTGFYSFTF